MAGSSQMMPPLTNARVQFVIFVGMQGFIVPADFLQQSALPGPKRDGIHHRGLLRVTIERITHPQRVRGSRGNPARNRRLGPRADFPHPAHILPFAGFQRLHHALNVIGIRAGMSIQPQNDFPPRSLNSPIDARRNGAGVIVNHGHLQVGVFALKLRDDFARAVGGMPVRNGDIHQMTRVGLRKNRIQQSADAFFLVETGNDDRNGRRHSETREQLKKISQAKDACPSAGSPLGRLAGREAGRLPNEL